MKRKASLATKLIAGLAFVAALSTQGMAAVTQVGTPTAVPDNSQPNYQTFGYSSVTTLGYARDFGNGVGTFFSWTRNDTLGTTFYNNNSVTPGNDVAFPTTFQATGGETAISTGNGAIFGADNWIAFNNNEGQKGWISFTLSSTGFINTMNYFLYDPSKPAGMPLSDAIAFRTGTNPVLLAPVPEFSSGLAIGTVCMIGALSRRSRRRQVLA